MADDAQSQFSGTGPVAPQHAFDVTRLTFFMREHVSGFHGERAVDQFKGGQSNPTFLLTAGGNRYLRPPGGLARADLAAFGIPGEADYLRRYLDRVGSQREPNPDEWAYYLLFNMFRLVGILQGVAARALHGNAPSAQAVETGRRTRPLADQAWALAQRIGKG